MGSREFIALIAAMMALTALSVDIMLPALPAIGEALGLADANDRQSLVIVYLLGFAIGQLAFGRLSDLYGRKPVLLSGMSIFIVGSVLAALSSDYHSIMLARALQGLGAASPRVIAIALVRDRYVGSEMSRVMSISMAGFFTVAVLAPTIGQALLLVGAWTLVFDFILLCGIGLALWAQVRLPKPAPAGSAKPLALVASARRAICTPQTMGYAAAGGFMMACVVGFIASAQQVFVDVFATGWLFPLAFAATAMAMTAASLSNAMLVSWLGMRRLSHMSLSAFVMVASLLVIETVVGWASLPVFIGTTIPLFLLFGLVAPNFNAIAMQPQGDNAGMASSVVGFVSTGLGALGGGLIGHLFDGTVLPLALGLLTFGLLAFAAVLWVEGVSGFLLAPAPQPSPHVPGALPAIRTHQIPTPDQGSVMSNQKPTRVRTPETKVVHAARAPRANFGFVNPPVFRGSTVLFPSTETFLKGDQPYTYGRISTPTVRALEEAIAEIEGGVACAVTSSGYQAISTAILAFVKTGDHILMVDSAYQPTRKFCDEMLSKLGIETTYYDPLIGAGIAALVRPNTRLIYTESPGSQTFEIQDIPAIARVAAERNLWLLLDNTWASPLYFKPFEHGVDVSIHAATKYIVGHADAVLGTITSNARAAKHVAKAKELLGICPGSEETFLGMRGLRTLPTRLMQHQRSAITIARWLEGRPEVARVLHPALPSHPQHHIWKRDFSGSSGLFSVVLKPASSAAVAAMLDGLSLFGIGLSWGGYESLIIPFDARSYRTATDWNPDGPTLRVHVGLEDTEELRCDLEAGFDRLAAVEAMTAPPHQAAASLV